METANDHGDGSSTGIRQREGCHALNPGSEPSTLPTRIKNHENQPRYRIEFFNGIGQKLPFANLSVQYHWEPCCSRFKMVLSERIVFVEASVNVGMRFKYG